MKTILICLVLCGSAFGNTVLASQCNAAIAVVSSSTAFIGMHVGKYSAEMPGGEVFADAWSHVSAKIRSTLTTLSTALVSAGISDPTFTTYINGADPASVSDIQSLMKSLGRLRDSALAAQ